MKFTVIVFFTESYRTAHRLLKVTATASIAKLPLDFKYEVIQQHFMIDFYGAKETFCMAYHFVCTFYCLTEKFPEETTRNVFVGFQINLGTLICNQ